MTDEHHRYEDDVAAYALGALNPLEVSAFERHMMRCEACAGELERLRTVTDLLPAAVPQHSAPHGLRRAVMRAVRDEPRTADAPRRAQRVASPLLRVLPRRVSPALAGGLAALALVAGGYGIGATGSEDDSRVVAATVDRTQLPTGRAELASQGDVGVLRVAGLPAPPRGEVYVVWVDRGNGPVYSTSFNLQPDGDGAAGIPTLDDVERVMVTRESSTSVAHPTESPIVTVQLD